MKALFVALVLLGSCASKDRTFDEKKTCSPLSLNYIKNNKQKRFLQSQDAITEMEKTKPGVQACYEAYAKRTGNQEFDTCLVAAYDKNGKLDYWELSSQQVKLDNEFVSCTNKTLNLVPFWKLGKNYILLQSFQFYKD